MQISPVRNNYCNSTLNKKVSNQNFKSLLPQKDIKRILGMLEPAVTETIVSKDISILRRITDMLCKKYLRQGINSFGVLSIPDNILKEFCKNIKMPFCNLDSMKGFCVAAGGKYSPMEIWTRVYETKLILIPKDKIYA